MKAIIKIDNRQSYSSATELETAVLDALKFHKVVSPEEVSDYYSSSEEKEHNTECILDDTFSVWDEENNGETTYDVKVYAHYIGGSDWDYIYSYTVE